MILSELAAEQGAYILVSGGESPSDKGLRDRRRAMRDAVASLLKAIDLGLDFYGGDRIVRWSACCREVVRVATALARAVDQATRTASGRRRSNMRLRTAAAAAT